MLRELLSILRASDPLRDIGESFGSMLGLTLEMNIAAGQLFFGESDSATESKRIRERDIQVNQLERKIRGLSRATFCRMCCHRLWCPRPWALQTRLSRKVRCPSSGWGFHLISRHGADCYLMQRITYSNIQSACFGPVWRFLCRC